MQICRLKQAQGVLHPQHHIPLAPGLLTYLLALFLPGGLYKHLNFFKITPKQLSLIGSNFETLDIYVLNTLWNKSQVKDITALYDDIIT